MLVVLLVNFSLIANFIDFSNTEVDEYPRTTLLYSVCLHRRENFHNPFVFFLSPTIMTTAMEKTKTTSMTLLSPGERKKKNSDDEQGGESQQQATC